MKKKKPASLKRISSKTQVQVHKKEHTLLYVVIRPLLALIWGLGSTTFTFSLIYSLCYYPSRDICTSPYEWLSILPIHEKLLIFTLGLPTFITDMMFRSFTNIAPNVMELWWLALCICSFIVAYIIVTLLYRFILVLRYASAAHAKR